MPTGVFDRELSLVVQENSVAHSLRWHLDVFWAKFGVVDPFCV